MTWILGRGVLAGRRSHSHPWGSPSFLINFQGVSNGPYFSTMISIDTETTGLWWQHETVAFAIGIDNNGEYTSHYLPVDPHTREVIGGWSSELKKQIRDYLSGSDPVVFQNANFDLKALCRAGIIDWQEPSNPEFWGNIIELSHLMHLHDSTDARSKSSLKTLAPKYLGGNYQSEQELGRIIRRCRIFLRNRDSGWQLSSTDTLPQAPANSEFWKSDMWLPAAMSAWDPQDELAAKLGEDYARLPHLIDKYLKDDCQYTRELAEGFLSILYARHTPEELDKLMLMNRDLFPAVWQMEIQGIPVDRDKLAESIKVCKEWVGRCHRECQRISGIQVKTFTPAIKRDILFNQFGLEATELTETGLAKTDQKTLRQIKDSNIPDRADKFLRWDLAKSKYATKERYLSSYQRMIQLASRVPYNHQFKAGAWYLFPNLKSTGTGTTRFAGSNPNSQNIEKPEDKTDAKDDVSQLLAQSPSMRAVFGPQTDRWWYLVDYSQLQLRIFATATRDPALIQAFEDGHDFHDFMGRVIFELPESQSLSARQRRVAKNVNFAFVFGASEKKIDATANKSGLYGYLMQCFPNAKEFIEQTKALIAQEGLVYTLGGYPLHIPLRDNPWGGQSYAAHMGVNYIIQGTEGELVKRAMALTYNYLRVHYPAGKLVMQIHDELIFDAPARTPTRHIAKLCELMNQAGKELGINSPVSPEVCKRNFAEKEALEL